MEHVTLDITGMTCANCALRIEKGLTKIPGVLQARVNYAMETATLDFDPATASTDAFVQKIDTLGYKAKAKDSSDPDYHEREREKEYRITLKSWIVSTLLSAPLAYTMAAHMGLEFLPVPHLLMNPWFQLILAAPVQFVIGARFYKGAWRALRDFSANMDTLVAMGTSAAFFYSLYMSLVKSEHGQLFYETSAVLITLILFGKLLELRARGKTSSAIRKLMSLQAKNALVIRDGLELTVSIDDVRIGDSVLVKPGETIPVDGTVLDGHSAVNEAMITGESMPVEKQKDDTVIGATLNQYGALVIRADKIGAGSTLSRIVRAVQEAQGARAPIQRFADRVSGVFTPAVILIALLSFFVWYFFLDGGNLGRAIENAIAVLVIACPCALGLATPTSIMAGSGRGAEFGVLFRGGQHLESAGSVKIVALDKTGTVTKGEPRLIEVFSHEKDDSDLLRIAASVEKQSEHPLAQALVLAATDRNVTTGSVSRFQASPGGGVSAEFDVQAILIGSPAFIESQSVDTDAYQAKIREMEERGMTVVVIAADAKVLGCFAIADQIRPEASEVIKRLTELGIETVMITGDNERTAKAIAEQAGVRTFRSGVKPEEKARIITELKAGGVAVAMVGDGINDAPALAAADVGIAMGGGSDIAIETADVALMSADLHGLVRVIELSRMTMKNIRQNLFWALAYNALGIPFAAAGLLAPWIAGAAMAMSSVSVTMNALRLQRLRLK